MTAKAPCRARFPDETTRLPLDPSVRLDPLHPFHNAFVGIKAAWPVGLAKASSERSMSRAGYTYTSE